MKIKSAITIGLIAASSLIAGANINTAAVAESKIKAKTTETRAANDDFELAVEIIKKYEGLHSPRHWPLIGYGHLVTRGEKYSRSKALGEKEAEALLRKDLLKNCAAFRSFGPDSLILGVLAYNIGSGATMRSPVAKKLKAGDRDIYDSYLSHCRFRGKVNSQLRRRRIEEFEKLFIKNPAAKVTKEKHTPVQEEVKKIEEPRHITHLYTPAMQYPTEMIPQLQSAHSQLQAMDKATRRKETNAIKNKKLTACISRYQQYYWL